MMRKRPRHFSQAAKLVVDIATGQAEDRASSVERSESGARDGRTRASHLTAAQRSEAAKLAAQARWRKKT